MTESASAKARRVLLVAFHFPPFRGSSGALRTLSFVRYLPQFGWTPSVLTATAGAYEEVGAETLDLVRDGTRVRRAFALDSRRHLSLGGRYISAMALPDRWVSWLPAAVLRGVAAVLRDSASVVWSTYPLATSHVIGCAVARLTGRPWVADFRDPMVERNARTGKWAPADESVRRARLWIEWQCARHATRLVFCTEGARDIFVRRHGDAVAERCKVIENGYDEETFNDVETVAGAAAAPGRPFTLLHSGVIYPTPDRDPAHLLEALANLRQRELVSSERLRLRLRATANDAAMMERIDRFNVGDLVELAPPVPYLQALSEMMEADALLVLQGYTSDPAVPAKLYEYMRARRPVLALVSPTGETARIVRRESLGPVADIESVVEIERAVLQLLHERKHVPMDASRLTRYSRRERCRELAGVLDGLPA